MTFMLQKTFFGFLVMVYDRVGDGINFHMRILVLEGIFSNKMVDYFK